MKIEFCREDERRCEGSFRRDAGPWGEAHSAIRGETICQEAFEQYRTAPVGKVSGGRP